MFERLDFLRDKANHLPLCPGVYQMKNKSGEIKMIIKLAVLDNCAWTPREAAEALAEATDSAVVCTIGKKLVLYRPSKKNPKIVLE